MPDPIERLAARPWRIMEWIYPPDGPRYAVCIDAFATHADAVREAAKREGAWVESMPEFPVLEVK